MQGLFQFLTYATYFYYVRHEQTFLLVVTQGLHRDLNNLGKRSNFQLCFSTHYRTIDLPASAKSRHALRDESRDF